MSKLTAVKRLFAIHFLVLLGSLLPAEEPISMLIKTDRYESITSSSNLLGAVLVPFHPNQLILPVIFLAVVCILLAVIIYRSRAEKGVAMELLMGLAAAGVGCFWGLLAQVLYLSGELPLFGNGNENPYWVGGVSGGILGFLAGVWFAQFLKTRFGRKDSSAQIFGKGLLAGIGVGVVCSTLVHSVLMLAYRNDDFRPMLIGALFGLGAGALLAIALLIVFMLGRQFNWIKPTGANDGNN